MKLTATEIEISFPSFGNYPRVCLLSYSLPLPHDFGQKRALQKYDLSSNQTIHDNSTLFPSLFLDVNVKIFFLNTVNVKIPIPNY